jgi:hypothetical protein
MRAAILSLVLMGCGLSPRGYCDEVAASSCARGYRCAKTEEERQALGKDQNDCTKNVRLQLGCERIDDESKVCESIGLKYSPANAATCISKLQQLSCESSIGSINCNLCE